MQQNTLSISQFLKQSNKSIINFGEDIILTNTLGDVLQFKYPFRIDGVTIFICVDGNMDCNVNLQDYHIEKNGIFVNFPENIIQVKDVNNLEMYSMVISTKFINELMIDNQTRFSFYLESKKSLLTYVNHEDLMNLKPYVDLMEININKIKPESREVMKGLVMALLMTVRALIKEKSKSEMVVKQSRSELLFAEYVNLLTMYHTKERMVKFYANKMCITTNYLSLLVKENSGKSPSDWINEYVIIEAKTLLRFSDKTIKEITYELHFPTQSSFGKYFKQQIGISPKLYRKKGSENRNI